MERAYDVNSKYMRPLVYLDLDLKLHYIVFSKFSTSVMLWKEEKKLFPHIVSFRFVFLFPHFLPFHSIYLSINLFFTTTQIKTDQMRSDQKRRRDLLSIRLITLNSIYLFFCSCVNGIDIRLALFFLFSFFSSLVFSFSFQTYSIDLFDSFFRCRTETRMKFHDNIYIRSLFLAIVNIYIEKYLLKCCNCDKRIKSV